MVSAGSYALAAHDTLRRAVAGLAVAVPGLTIYAKASHQGFLGLLTPRVLLGGEKLGGTWFLALEIGVFWMAGVFVRARRQAAALAGDEAADDGDGLQGLAGEVDLRTSCLDNRHWRLL